MFRLVFSSLLLLLIGCASTHSALQRATARSVQGVRPDHVLVSDVRRGMTSVQWQANTPQGAVTCTADDMVRHTVCVSR